MATVDDTIRLSYKDSSILMACPHCGEEVEFPFVVEMLMTADDTSMQIEAAIFGGRINEQPLYDHMSERHE